MRPLSLAPLWGLLALCAGLAAPPSTQADALSAVQLLREGGCGGIMPAAQPLRHNLLLDRAAEQWASGHSLETAAEGSGYRLQSTAGVHVSGSEESLLQLLRRSDCRTVVSRNLSDIGIYRRGSDSWLVLASAYRVPSSAQGPSLAARALELVNDARTRGTRCGERWYAPAPPLTLSAILGGVALGHANDMAAHNYFEHVDLAGKSPADRVRAVGYHEKLVGENIAYGLPSVEEAVDGWLESPEHCENIMDPRFVQMGLGYAAGRGTRHGLYWVQDFATPRS
jgi:uncharacterized protein YkwD